MHLARSLLKRDIHFVATSEMQKELNIIKEDIANSVTLIDCDPKNASSLRD